MTAEIVVAFILGALFTAILATWLYRRSDQRLTESRVTGARLASEIEAKSSRINELEAGISTSSEVLAVDREAAIKYREEISVLKTSLAEQKNQTEEKLTLLKDAREGLHAGFKNLANEIFESKQKEFTAQSKAQLNGVLDPLHERLKFEK